VIVARLDEDRVSVLRGLDHGLEVGSVDRRIDDDYVGARAVCEEEN
jgi:hypothetical protein